MSNEKKNDVVTEYNIMLEAVRLKGNSDDGKAYDFIAFHTYDKTGKKAKIKFTKAVKKDLIPEKAGTYTLVVEKKNISKDKYNKYPVFWVKEIKALTEYEPSALDNDEDLPL